MRADAASKCWSLLLSDSPIYLWQMMPRIAVAIAFFLSAMLSGQTPAEPRFDVVSIREVPPNTPPTMIEFGSTPVLPGGRYIDPRAVLHVMISFVYGIPTARQLVGLPKWAEETSTRSPKPADGFPCHSSENREQVRSDGERDARRAPSPPGAYEDRHETVYSLEIASGLKIKEVEPPDRPPTQPPVQVVYE